MYKKVGAQQVTSKCGGHKGAESIPGWSGLGRKGYGGFWGQKEDQKGLRRGEEAEWWSWGEQGH